MSPSPPPPPVVHGGNKSPTTAAAASGARGNSIGTAQSDDNQTATTNSVSSFLRGKTFVQKIHTLLTMTKYSSIISWNDAGTAVIIHDVDAFISTIIPAHFKQSKFGSFIRKMRRWGFSVITKKRSTSRTSTSSERGQIAVMEFSSEHFLRDQPELCLLMKDERHVKTQFSFLDRTVRKAHLPNGVGENPDGVCVMKTSKNKSKSQQQSGVSSFAMVPSSKDTGCTGAGGLNTTINHGYPHNHAHSNSMPSPMITPHQHQQSFHSAMPMVNMMMPPPPPPPQYPPYGYGAPPLPPQAPGLGFGPSSPPFQSPSAPNGYPPYPYQQQQVMQQYQQQQAQMASLSPQQQQMMQPYLQQQQQMMQPYPQQPQQKVQQYQQQHQCQQQYQPQQQQPLEQQNQQCPPPPTDDLNLTTVSSKRGLLTNFAASTTPNGCSDTMASSATGGAAVQLSSSEESTELLPNLDLNMRVYSRLNTEHNEV